jgi:hypothetical protein
MLDTQCVYCIATLRDATAPRTERRIILFENEKELILTDNLHFLSPIKDWKCPDK